MISRDILPAFPTGPGFYLMKNAAGRIVYVGKAKHVRKRLASYFQPEHRRAQGTGHDDPGRVH